MKITKVTTDAGEFGTPVSTELSAVVERMQSEKNKETAARIAADTLGMRLMMDQGSPGYVLPSIDLLPYLIFSATFGRGGFDNPISFSGLVLLNIPCPEGLLQVDEMRKRVGQIPYTLLAFAGVSGVTLKVVVRCDYHAGGDGKPLASEDHAVQAYAAFLQDAHDNAARLYATLAQCDVVTGRTTITDGCRMGYDSRLYYNPQALPMPVVRQGTNPLKPYEGTRTDDNGTVIWYPDYEQRERI